MAADHEYTTIVDSPVGYLGLQLDGEILTGLDFLGKQITPDQMQLLGKLSNKITHRIFSALDTYFIEPDKVTSPVTLLKGTDFQQKVWQQLALIKSGHTRTYGEIASQLESSPRAVGNACRRNPIPIFIPCHRVVSASGRGGFMGKTSGEAMDIKEWLLQNEQKNSTA